MESSILIGGAILAELCWLGRLVLVAPKRYPVLISFLTWNVLSPLIWWGARSLGLRAEYMVAGSVLSVAFSVAALLEVHSIVMERYRGFHKLGATLTHITIWGTGLIVIAVTFLVPAEWLQGWSRMIPFQMGNVNWALSVVAVVLIGFFRYFQLRLSRNTKVYLGAFTFYLLSSATLNTAAFIGPQLLDLSRSARPVAFLIFVGVGALFFSKAGESAGEPGATNAVPVEVARESLEAMNEALLRVFKDNR